MAADNFFAQRCSLQRAYGTVYWSPATAHCSHKALEQCIQLIISPLHGIQFILQVVDIPAQFCGVSLVAVLSELPLPYPYEACDPVKVIQHNELLTAGGVTHTIVDDVHELQFPLGVEVDGVGEEVEMDVFPVCVSADQDFVPHIVLS